MNKLSIGVRVASAADAEAVSRLLARSYPVLMAPAYEASVLAAALPLMTRANPALLSSGSYYVTETADGEIVGCGGWTAEQPGSGAITAETGHIRHFATDPAWLRRGIGGRLLARSIDEARNAGIRQLDCFSSLNAVPFYAGAGFAMVAPVEVPLTDRVRLPSALMRRAI